MNIEHEKLDDCKYKKKISFTLFGRVFELSVTFESDDIRITKVNKIESANVCNPLWRGWLLNQEFLMMVRSELSK